MYTPKFNPRVRKSKKSGLYLFEIRDNSGKTVEHQSGFKTKREAENEAMFLQQKLRQGFSLDRHTSLFDWYQVWYDLKIRPKQKLSEVTKKNYRMYGTVIKKLFGDRSIMNIRATEYQRIMNIYGETVGYDYLARVNGVIRKTVKLAQADKIVLDDFTENVELFAGKNGQKNDEKYIHSEEDYQSLLARIERDLDYSKSIIGYVLLFLAKTGMRYGELIGLTWDDVSFEQGYLYTHRRFNTTAWNWSKAKNETSIRYVPLDSKMLVILKELKEKQALYNQDLEISNDEGFVFFHYGLVNGVPSIASVNKMLRKYLVELNIRPIISTKGLRHTYGSILLHRNIDMGVVAKILGHRDIQMLIKVYGHTLKERIDKEFYDVVTILETY